MSNETIPEKGVEKNSASNEKTFKQIKEVKGDRKEKSKDHKKKKGAAQKKKRDPYIKEVSTEMRRVTWPNKGTVVKWSIIVICTLIFFTLFTLVSDNFIVTPIMYFVSGITETTDLNAISVILTITLFISGLLLLIAIMMHSGSDGGGLSDSAATSVSGGANSTAVIERNLDRITVILAIIFVISLLGLMLFFPQGVIANA